MCALGTEMDLTSSINLCASPGTGYGPEQSKSSNEFIAVGNATVTQNLLQLPN